MDEKCCVCDRYAVEHYDDNELLPYCGSFACGMEIQAGIDFIEECGNR